MTDKQSILLRLIRETYTSQATLGKLFVNGIFFGYTLEDTVRAFGIKVPKHTAIPAYIYKIKLNYSPHFGRIMTLIYNQEDESIFAMGIRFTGIRFHGGNRHSDTEGCILLAKNRISDCLIQGSLEKEIYQVVRDAELQNQEVILEIING